MSIDDAGVPVRDLVPTSRPKLRERFVAVFRFSVCFSKKSDRGSGKKRSSRTKTNSFETQKKARSSNESAAKPTDAISDRCTKKNVKEVSVPQIKTQDLSSISHPRVMTGSKVAHYQPPKRYTSVRIGSVPTPSTRSYSGPLSASRNNSGPRNYSGPLSASRNYSLTSSRRNAGTQCVPVGGEVSKGGSTGGSNLPRAPSKGLSKLRDQYVRAMVKLGDMTHSVSMGTSVGFESQAFESEVFRKRSQADNEIMDYFLNSGIQPDEWRDAHMGSRIIRDGTTGI